MNDDFSIMQGDPERAVIKVTVQEESIRVPCTKLEANRYGVVTGSTWQLEEAGVVEKHGKGVCFHAGEGQVALLGQSNRQINHESCLS